MPLVLLVSHDSGMRLELDELFAENAYQNFEIDEVRTGGEALRRTINVSYDLLILNLTLPDTDMLGLIGKLKSLRPGLPILTYSFELEYTFIKRYLTSGVNGYLFYKKEENVEMLKAIQSIVSGKWYISQEMVEMIVEDALYGKKADRLDALSEREFEVFSHLVKDETPAVIAEILSVHTSTIALYRSRIMDKLRITNLIEMKNMLKVPLLV